MGWTVGQAIPLQQKLSDLLIVAPIIVVAAIYYAIYLVPRAGHRWEMRKSVYTEGETSSALMSSDVVTPPAGTRP